MSSPQTQLSAEEDKQEKIVQTMEMCDIDESTAMDLLEAHGWSIERALDLHFHRLTNPTPSKDRSSDVSAVQPAPVMTPTPEKESGTAVEEEQIENVPALGAQAAAPKTPTKPEPEQVPEGCWSVSDFVVGGPVMILSPKGKWRECTVVAVDNSPANGRANWAGAIQVHYVGFRSEFNEWLGLAEGKRRIRVAATRAAAKLRVGLGEMSPSQRNQEFAKAKPCLPWLSDSPM